MSINNSGIIILAAVLASPASALLSNSNSKSLLSQHSSFGRPSFLKLDANRQPFSELDNLRAKRMSIRQRHNPTDVAVENYEKNHDIIHEDVIANDSSITLEYLYEAGEERHADDLFHIILMPSTFHKDHMSVEEVAKSLADTIPGIQFDKAHDLSLFAKHQGFSVLGSSTREECLSLGEKLLASNLDCRIIPYNRGVVAPESFPEETVVAGALSQEAIVDDTYLLSYN